MSGSSLPRAWTLWLEISQVCYHCQGPGCYRVITVKGLNDCVWMSRVISVKGLNIVSGGQSSLFNQKKFFLQGPGFSGLTDQVSGCQESSLSRALNVVSGCQGHHCQEPKRWCLEVSQVCLTKKNFYKKKNFRPHWSSVWMSRVISIKGLNVVSGVSGSSLFNKSLKIVSGCQKKKSIKGLNDCVWMSRVISIKGLNVVSGCQGHQFVQGPGC